MNEDNFEQKIEKKWGRPNRSQSKEWTGIFLLIIGGLLLARTMGVLFPVWFFTWPVFLIALGVFVGLRHKFRSGPWLILILIGSIFLANKVQSDINLKPYMWPIILISVGVYLIFRPKNHRFKSSTTPTESDFTNHNYSEPSGFQIHREDKHNWQGATGNQDNALDITTIFGGVKKNILSKDFKGGDVVAIMGGAEINLLQADFKGRVMIDNFTLFGGTKFIVPPDWNVQSEIVALFGGVDDKRPPAAHHDPSKVIILDGTCIFGGIEIRSY